MKVVAIFNPRSAVSGTFNAGFTSGSRRVVIYNQSNVNLMLSWDAFTTYLPAWTVMLYCITTSNANINWSQQNILQMFNSPVSIVTVELYDNAEPIVGTFPAPVQHQSAVSLTGNTQVTYSANFGIGVSVGGKQNLNVFNPANSGITYTFHSARAFTSDTSVPLAFLNLVSGTDLNLAQAVSAVSHSGSASPIASTAHVTAEDANNTHGGTDLDDANIPANTIIDFLTFPDSVSLAPGNNLRIGISSSVTGKTVRLTMKWTEEQAPAPVLATGTGAGLTVANQLIQTGQTVGTTLIRSVPSGDSGNALFATNDGQVTIGDATNHGKLTVGPGPSLVVFPDAASGNDVVLSQTGKTAQVVGQLDVVQNGVFESDVFIHNAKALNLTTGLIRRISLFTATLTTAFANYPHGLGVLPDLILGINTGTSLTVTTFKWNPAASDATNASLVASNTGITFTLVALQLT